MRHSVIPGFLIVFVMAGCVDNESSIYVTEMKIPPKPPDCVSSPSDAFASTGLLDLTFRTSYSSFFLVRNNLMSREDYTTLSTETAGVVIEGAEVSVRAVDGTLLGATEYYEFEGYVPPESEDIVFASVIPAAIGIQISQQVGCPTLSDLPFGSNVNYDIVYSDVKFLGHTTGGTDVETPSFTVPISLCCGCLVNWLNCGTGCDRYCEDPEESGMCLNGVANGGDLFDCRVLYNDMNATWQETDENGVLVTVGCDSC